MAKLVHILNKVDGMNGSQRQGADKINAICFENTLFLWNNKTKQNKWNAVGLGSTFNLNIETKLQFFFYLPQT